MLNYVPIMVIVCALASPAVDPAVIATMDENRFATPPTKARADVVGGKVGKAVRFRFDDKAQSTFFTSNIRGTPDWDEAAGFSF